MVQHISSALRQIPALKKFFNRRDAGLCPFCGLTVKPEELRDVLSRKEYHISGLCQKCQDETFVRW